MKVIKQKALKSNLIVAVIGLTYILFWPKQYRLPCPIHSTTGIWCPGCGSTRALDALLHGNLPLAFNFNPLLISSPVFIVLGVLVDRSRFRRILLPVYLASLLVLIVIFTVIRNLPNSSLAPI